MSSLTRRLPLHFHLDTNCINSRQVRANLNLLEQWAASGLIALELSETAQIEASQGGDRRRRRKALQFPATETLATNPEERELLLAIERALFGQVQSPAQRRDVIIVFNAKKYGAILVTSDGASRRQPRGILGSAAELAHLGVTVMSDDQAVAHVRHWIDRRDILAQNYAAQTGEPVPEWVGRD